MRKTFGVSEKRNSLMIDLETFITTLYVMVDDFCQSKQEEPIVHSFFLQGNTLQ